MAGADAAGSSDDGQAGGDGRGKPHYVGHRQRLRQRFLESGAQALPDYELVELILFGAIPRRDVKPLAKDLVTRFGGFAGIINADPEALRAVKGLNEAGVVALKAVRAGAERLARQEVLNRPVLSSWEQVERYIRTAMAHEKREQLRLLFLDRRNVLIADEVQQTGTIDHTPAYPREVVKRALDLGAAALILAHNHPSGDATPSKADIAMTREIRDAARPLGVILHDHVVVGREETVSFKNAGLL